MTDLILTLNAGSSSIKFALFAAGAELSERARGQVEGIGGAARFKVKSAGNEQARVLEGAQGADHDGALAAILAWLDASYPGARIAGVGHRVVHGGPEHRVPVEIDPELIADLERLVPLAPLHQPHNLAGIRAAQRTFPQALQLACFDTAFHRTQPPLRQSFAIPNRYFDAGVRRYGFHGLSYAYVVDALRHSEPVLAQQRLVVAHLGNGASMAAIVDGKSVASTMGFTALDGLVMGTRSGSIDPGVLLFMLDVEHLDSRAITHMLYNESGLLGVSGLSNDMRTLLASDAPQARFAVDLFVDRAVRCVGDLAAAMDGIDGLVFTGGIGENASAVRAAIAGRLRWTGAELDTAANERGDGDIGAAGSRVALRVVRTNEEAMIARATHERLASHGREFAA